MTEQQMLLWESGQSSAPLPPLVDLRDREQEVHTMVALYRTYGPLPSRTNKNNVYKAFADSYKRGDQSQHINLYLVDLGPA